MSQNRVLTHGLHEPGHLEPAGRQFARVRRGAPVLDALRAAEFVHGIMDSLGSVVFARRAFFEGTLKFTLV